LRGFLFSYWTRVNSVNVAPFVFVVWHSFLNEELRIKNEE
jgi:hypothetical protein